MKPDDKIQLMSGLLDLPILDKDWRYCGIVDDIEFEEGGDGPPRVKALLTGPGAYRGRLPGWAFRILRWLVGEHVSRIPWEAIAEIGSAAVLKSSGDAYGLHCGDDKARRLIPHGGAL